MTAAAQGLKGIPPSLRLIAGLTLAFANFMVILDLTIANVSIPHIAASLGVSLEQGAWVITSYAIAEAICVPLTVWRASVFSRCSAGSRFRLRCSSSAASAKASSAHF